MYNNYFDQQGVYTHSLPAMAGSLPPSNALREETVPQMRDASWSMLNQARNGWEYIEDHRQHMDEKGNKTGGTPFWLPGDAHDAAARYMETVGPLPDGALLAAPEMTAEEKAVARREEILSELAALDAQYLTPRIQAGLAMEDGYAVSQWERHEELASPLRLELAALI